MRVLSLLLVVLASWTGPLTEARAADPGARRPPALPAAAEGETAESGEATAETTMPAGGAISLESSPRPQLVHRVAGLYESVSPAVVALTCRGSRGTYFGTGTIIDPTGIILTSVTVIPRGAVEIQAYLSGGRVAECRPLLDDDEREIALVRIRRPERLVRDGGELPWLDLGESRALGLGDPVYSLGNSFHSIEQDDRVTLAAGIVSGLFDLDEKRSESTYLGRVIETSAALNNGMDGGPLLDARGRVVGLLSLNFSPHRWLGTAVPIDALKPLIAKHRDWFDDRFWDESQEERNGWPKHYIGAELDEVGKREIRILRVKEGGPAFVAGLREGDRLRRLGDEPLARLEELRDALRSIGEDDGLTLTVERGEDELEISVRPWRRF